MTTDNILVLGILAVAILLFVSERLRVDVVAMLVLVALVLTGLVTVEEAFSGFASPAVIVVWAVFIVSAGLTRCGGSSVAANDPGRGNHGRPGPHHGEGVHDRIAGRGWRENLDWRRARTRPHERRTTAADLLSAAPGGFARKQTRYG